MLIKKGKQIDKKRHRMVYYKQPRRNGRGNTRSPWNQPYLVSSSTSQLSHAKLIATETAARLTRLTDISNLLMAPTPLSTK